MVQFLDSSFSTRAEELEPLFFSFRSLFNLNDNWFMSNDLNSNFVHWMNRKDEELSIFKIQEELL